MLESLRKLTSRLVALFSRRRIERDFEQELATHVELIAEQNLRSGMSAEEAERVARVRLGGMAALEETNRDLHGFPTMESLGQDLVDGMRMLRRSPGFTAI